MTIDRVPPQARLVALAVHMLGGMPLLLIFSSNIAHNISWPVAILGILLTLVLMWMLWRRFNLQIYPFISRSIRASINLMLNSIIAIGFALIAIVIIDRTTPTNSGIPLAAVGLAFAYYAILLVHFVNILVSIVFALRGKNFKHIFIYPFIHFR